MELHERIHGCCQIMYTMAHAGIARGVWANLEAAILRAVCLLLLVAHGLDNIKCSGVQQDTWTTELPVVMACDSAPCIYPLRSG